jgi:dolichyl-phosphate-mannose--protein O-mannosyl transferase
MGLREISWWLLPVVIAISIIIVIADNIRTSPNVERMRAEQYRRFEQQFDRTEGGQDNE